MIILWSHYKIVTRKKTFFFFYKIKLIFLTCNVLKLEYILYYEIHLTFNNRSYFMNESEQVQLVLRFIISNSIYKLTRDPFPLFGNTWDYLKWSKFITTFISNVYVYLSLFFLSISSIRFWCIQHIFSSISFYPLWDLYLLTFHIKIYFEITYS